MSPKIKNIIIAVVALIALVLIYFFFIKKSSDVPLTSSTGSPNVSAAGTDTSANPTTDVNKDFVSILLSVNSIKLNDSIFQNQAFISLRDSSITLIQVGDEGRINPFAPIGVDTTNLPTDQGLVPVINPTTAETGVVTTTDTTGSTDLTTKSTDTKTNTSDSTNTKSKTVKKPTSTSNDSKKN